MTDNTRNGSCFSLFALRLGYGFMFLAFGLDKFFNKIVPWLSHLDSRATSFFFGLDATHILYGIGIVDIAIACLLLCSRSRLGGYLAMVGFVLAAANFYLLGMYDTAIRSATLALGGLVIARTSCTR